MSLHLLSFKSRLADSLQSVSCAITNLAGHWEMGVDTN